MEFDVDIYGEVLHFTTNEHVFSPAGVDRGTLAMLSLVSLQPGERLLDLGCGFGSVGLWAARKVGPENVVMCDISFEAVSLSIENARKNGLTDIQILQSDAYEQVPAIPFHWILSNPPYHADFSVPKRFIEEGFRRLCIGGKFCMVTRRLDWYKNRLTSVFGGVRVHEMDGYYIFISEKRTTSPPARSKKQSGGLSKKLARKMQNNT